MVKNPSGNIITAFEKNVSWMSATTEVFLSGKRPLDGSPLITAGLEGLCAQLVGDRPAPAGCPIPSSVLWPVQLIASPVIRIISRIQVVVLQDEVTCAQILVLSKLRSISEKNDHAETYIKAYYS